MNRPDALSDDDRFALLLGRCREIFRAGGDVDPSADASFSNKLRQPLQGALGCLRRLRGLSRAAAQHAARGSSRLRPRRVFRLTVAERPAVC
jgi:hypothetical protein